MTENSLFSGDALPKIKWSTIRAMGYCSKFWGNSPSTLQLHDWLGRGRYPCRILAFLDWNFKKNRESSTVTDRAAYLVAPSSHLQPQKIQDIDFRAPKKKKKLEILHRIQENQELDKSKEKKEKNVKERLVSKPTKMNYMNFYRSQINRKINQKYCELFLDLQINFNLNP